MSIGRIGSYELLERLGEGGQSVVFKARDTRPERLDRVVALKILKADLAGDPGSRARLTREARAEAGFSHPNVATCYEVGEAAVEPPELIPPDLRGTRRERLPFLAMEFVPGTDLAELARGRPLAIAEVVGLGIQVAAGLEVAHRAGVVHRDLKPGNVRLTPDGIVKIVDFGLARVLAPAGTDAADARTVSASSDHLLGTLPHMSPEQADGRPVDARSDLFALGTLLYQLVTGRLPFESADAGRLLRAIATEDAQPMARYASGVPGELERIVRKLHAKRPGDRYQSAHEVGTDLAALRDAIAEGAHAGRRRRRSAPALALALAALALLTAAVLAARGGLGALEPASRNLLVLPFENVSGDRALDHVATGFTDEVTGELVRRSGLNVASREALSAVPSGERAPRALARALGVGAILTGELHTGDGRPRLELRLLNARSGFVRWTAGFDWSYADAPRIRREVVDRVAERLLGRDAPRAHLTAADPASASAYEAFLRGVQHLDDADDPLAPDRASESFGRALVLDPEYAPAWAGRSKALFRIHARDHAPEALASAERAALEALRLDPGSLEGRVALAQIYRGTGRTAAAIAELQRVLAANPDWDEAYLQLAATHRDAGDLAAAERAVRRAVALRPDFWRNWNALGAIRLRRGDRDGARAAFTRIVELAPDMNRGYEQLAAIDLLEGRHEDAIATYRRLPTPVRDAALASNIANAYAGARRYDEARDYLALALRLEPRHPVLREHLGDLLTRLGRRDEAREAYAQGARDAAEMLRDTPARPELQGQHAVLLAKSGDCEGARRAFAGIERARLADAPELLYTLARGEAACGRRAPALDALRAALAHGVAAARPREDVEFDGLRADPAFARLVGSAPAADSTTGPP